MNAAEGLAVVGCMIAACRHGDRVHTRPTRDRLATVTLRDLRVMDVPGPDGSCAPALVDRRGPTGTARAGGGGRVPARFGEQSLASGDGACVIRTSVGAPAL